MVAYDNISLIALTIAFELSRMVSFTSGFSLVSDAQKSEVARSKFRRDSSPSLLVSKQVMFQKE